MKKILFILALLCTTCISYSQVLNNNTTARSYLSASTSWTQEEFNEYNNVPGMYQIKLPSDSTQSTSMILRYPELDSVYIYWANGVWNSNIETDLTTNFNTLLMVSGINHTLGVQTLGATTSSSWTSWAYGMTNFIPKPQSFEQFDENTMYPNPANDVVNLKGKLILTDLFGRVIISGIDILDVSKLSNGVYLLNNKKLIVQH